MPNSQTRTSLLAALLGALLVGGCTAAVEATPPPRAQDAACIEAAGSWPSSVSALGPVAVSPSSPAVRAWGDPPVIARCGVAEPGPSTDCLTVNDIDWVVTELSDGRKFVTFGRSPALEVLVPTRYAPEGALLPAFTEAASRLPQTGRHCT